MKRKIKSNNLIINLSTELLIEKILLNKEGILGRGWSIIVSTWNHTGRSPNDKYIVDKNEHKHEIWCDNNKKISKKNYDKETLKLREMFFKNFAQFRLKVDTDVFKIVDNLKI